MGKHVMQFRRKRKGRTDYRKRLMLLKSGLPRLVVRTSNAGVIAQLVTYEPDGDKVLVTVHSHDLKKHGWDRSAGNIPAAYLTGVLLADRAKKHITGDVILDIGLQKHHKGGRLYAVAKGAMEGGLKVRCSEEALPPDDRLTGAHIDKKLPGVVADAKIRIMSDRT